MRRLLVVLLAAVAPSVVTPTTAAAQTPGFRAQNVVGGLNLACAMAFAPDGRLFVVERTTGNIVVVEDGAVRGVWATIPVAVGPFAGLMGIAVDPDFVRNGYVYVSLTQDRGTVHNTVARLRDVNGAGVDFTVIGPQIPNAHIHNVGPMVIGSDGKLYVHTGDAGDPVTAQILGSPHGKILRMNRPDGTVPADNPFPGSLVWSYGHRNAFGLAVHPRLGWLYETENGWSGEDELNRIVRGGNYGWPIHDGTEQTPDPTTEDPLFVWAQQIAPTGCCFYAGGAYPSSYDEGWFLCGYNDGTVHFAELEPGGTAVRGVRTFAQYANTVYGVVNGPDGNLWVLYSTGDASGADRIDRIVYDFAPRPSVTMTAVSTVAVGGSVTLGVTGQNGDVVLWWLGASRFQSAVATPFGALWVPFDLVLPTGSITADDRTYLGLSLPSIPGLRGATVHAQAMTIAGPAALLTNPHALLLH